MEKIEGVDIRIERGKEGVHSPKSGSEGETHCMSKNRGRTERKQGVGGQ